MENILVPELGESIIEGTLTAWLVKENESFKSGDNLAEIETDKITLKYQLNQMDNYKNFNSIWRVSKSWSSYC